MPALRSLNVYLMQDNDGGAEQRLPVALPRLRRPADVHRAHGHDVRGIALTVPVWVSRVLARMRSRRKGSSALQLSREMEITHKSALIVLRRIRHGMGYDGGVKLRGTVETDEMYHGGKPRNRGREQARRCTTKTPVIGWCSGTATCVSG